MIYQLQFYSRITIKTVEREKNYTDKGTGLRVKRKDIKGFQIILKLKWYNKIYSVRLNKIDNFFN